uniref:Uncharacterized protein n=1 Tax=Tetranychus urticae TaxID=32264 RepID=T1KTK8_TETUR
MGIYRVLSKHELVNIQMCLLNVYRQMTIFSLATQPVSSCIKLKLANHPCFK